MSTYTKPLPKVTPLTKPFWDAAHEGRLVMQVCSDCGDMHFPPGPICPNCLSEKQDWRPVSGTGTLQSWIDFHRAYWPAFGEDLPYRVCLVQLTEGPLLITNLVGDSEGARLNAPVKVVFDKVTETITLPKFELTPSA